MLSGCSSEGEKRPNSDVNDILKGAGVEMQEPQKEYSDEFAALIIADLLPKSEINKIVKPSARQGKAEAILFDYGKRGKSLSFQKGLDFDAQVTFDLLIENEQGINQSKDMHD